MRKLKVRTIGILCIAIILCMSVTTVAVQKSQAQGQKKIFYKFPTTPEQENNRKILTPEERKEFDEKVKQIEQRHREYIKRPLPKTEAEQVKNWSDADKIKSDDAKLCEEIRNTDYLDNAIDTKEELLEIIDARICDLIPRLLPNPYYDSNIKERQEEKERVKTHLEEVEAFKKQVETADDFKIMDLIEIYDTTLRRKKIHF